MTTLTFDVDAFRVQFPAFANPVMFPDATLELYWGNATCYVSNEYSGCSLLQGDCRQYAINLMTAHLTAISVLVQNGQTPGIVDGSTIDKVTVSLLPPPVKSQWQWWLSTTPYGAALLALLQGRSVGGFYIGGSPQRAAFGYQGGYPCVYPSCT